MWEIQPVGAAGQCRDGGFSLDTWVSAGRLDARLSAPPFFVVAYNSGVELLECRFKQQNATGDICLFQFTDH